MKDENEPKKGKKVLSFKDYLKRYKEGAKPKKTPAKGNAKGYWGVSDFNSGL